MWGSYSVTVETEISVDFSSGWIVQFEKFATLNNAGIILWFYEQWSQTLSNMSCHGWELLAMFTSMCDWEKGKLDKSEQPTLIILKNLYIYWSNLFLNSISGVSKHGIVWLIPCFLYFWLCFFLKEIMKDNL